jgi:hypothetical protein
MSEQNTSIQIISNIDDNCGIEMVTLRISGFTAFGP